MSKEKKSSKNKFVTQPGETTISPPPKEKKDKDKAKSPKK
jgi:hypothetical protein